MGYISSVNSGLSLPARHAQNERPVRQVILLRVSAHVVKRQDGDGGFIRQWKRHFFYRGRLH